MSIVFIKIKKKVVGTQGPTTFFYFSFKKEKVAKENYTILIISLPLWGPRCKQRSSLLRKHRGVTSLVRVTDEGSEQSERAIYEKQKFARSTDASHPTLIRRLSPPPSPEGRLFSNRDSAIKFYLCVKYVFCGQSRTPVPTDC